MDQEEIRYKKEVAEKFNVKLIHGFWDGLHYGQFLIIKPVERNVRAQIFDLAFEMEVLAPVYIG